MSWFKRSRRPEPAAPAMEPTPRDVARADAVEIEIAGRRAHLSLGPDEAARARALARALEPLAAKFAERDPAAFFARLALTLAAEIDEATARVEALERGLRGRE